MSKWSDYLNSSALQLQEKAKQAGIIGHNATIGKNREDIIGDFLKKHLPSSLNQYKNARVISFDDQESNELDIIFTNNISINFLEEMCMYTNIESVAGIISVKSFLDKTQLTNALENLASVPQNSNKVLKFAGPQTNTYQRFNANHPSMHVFAYSGLEYNTILGHIKNFYKEHPEIPSNRYPKSIIVNCQWEIVYTGTEGSRTTDGRYVDRNTFKPSSRMKGFEGFPIARMLHNISGYTSWMPYMVLNPGLYLNAGYAKAIDDQDPLK